MGHPGKPGLGDGLALPPWLVHRPHTLEVVIGPHLGTEQVDDHIARIDQHPVALRQALYAGGAIACLLQPPRQVLGSRGDVALRAPRGDDQRIAQRRPAGKVDRDDVFGFVVVEGGEDARKQRRLGLAFRRGRDF